MRIRRAITGLLLTSLFARDVSAGLHFGLGHAVAKHSADVIDKAGITVAEAEALQHVRNGDPTLSSRVNWIINTGDPVLYSSTALGLDGTIYYGTSGHFQYYSGYWTQGQKPPAKPYGLFAYHPNGTLKWHYSDGTDAPVRGAPAIATDGTIYLAMERLTTTEAGTTEELHAINPDGTQKWKVTYCTTYSEIGTMSPAIASDGTIYVLGTELKAFNPNGTLKWQASLGGSNSYYATPAIASDGTIYVVYWTAGLGGGQAIRAYHPDGTEKWTSATVMGTYPISCSPSIAADGTIYIGALDSSAVGSYTGTLWAFDSNGVLKWKFAAQDFDVRSNPTIDTDGTIYFGTKGTFGFVYALHADGTLKWSYKTQDDTIGGGTDVYDSPVIGSDGTLYVASEWGWLYAFNPDGTVLWKDNHILPTGGINESSPVLGSDGTLYAGGTYGYFVAVQTSSPGLSATAQWPKFGYSIDNNARRP